MNKEGKDYVTKTLSLDQFSQRTTEAPHNLCKLQENIEQVQFFPNKMNIWPWAVEVVKMLVIVLDFFILDTQKHKTKYTQGLKIWIVAFYFPSMTETLKYLTAWTYAWFTQKYVSLYSMEVIPR